MKKAYIRKKISILRDFYILHKNDAREAMLRNILASKQNELQIDIFLHDILTGTATLDAAIGGAI